MCVQRDEQPSQIHCPGTEAGEETRREDVSARGKMRIQG